MTMPQTATQLRADLFKTLDRVVSTGEPVEIQRPGGTVRIIAARTGSRLAQLRAHPGTIVGDAKTLISQGWENEWQPFP